MAHRVARQLKGRAPDVPPALSPELFDLLCEMRLQLAAQQKQHAQLRQEMSAEVSSLWRAVLSGQAGTGKLASGATVPAPVTVPIAAGLAPPAAAASPAAATAGSAPGTAPSTAPGTARSSVPGLGLGGLGGYHPPAAGISTPRHNPQAAGVQMQPGGGNPSERERMLEERLLANPNPNPDPKPKPKPNPFSNPNPYPTPNAKPDRHTLPSNGCSAKR